MTDEEVKAILSQHPHSPLDAQRALRRAGVRMSRPRVQKMLGALRRNVRANPAPKASGA